MSSKKKKLITFEDIRAFCLSRYKGERKGCNGCVLFTECDSLIKQGYLRCGIPYIYFVREESIPTNIVNRFLVLAYTRIP